VPLVPLRAAYAATTVTVPRPAASLFLSDQFAGFHAIVVPGTLRDSLYILVGLLADRRTSSLGRASRQAQAGPGRGCGPRTSPGRRRHRAGPLTGCVGWGFARGRGAHLPRPDRLLRRARARSPQPREHRPLTSSSARRRPASGKRVEACVEGVPYAEPPTGTSHRAPGPSARKREPGSRKTERMYLAPLAGSDSP